MEVKCCGWGASGPGKRSTRMETKTALSDGLNLGLSELLLVTASQEDATLWLNYLKDAGWQGTAEVLTDPSAVCAKCQQRKFHAILLDQSHPLLNSRLTSELLRRLGGHPPVILITDAPGEISALEGLASGAFDYVFRSYLGRLPVATQRAVETSDLKLGLEGADDQLKESEQRFQILSDSIPTGIAIESNDGILHANPALASLLNATSSLELLGRSLSSLVPSETWPAVQEKLNSLAGGQNRIRFQAILCSLDGSPTETEITAVEITFRGHPARLLAIQDQREQKRVASIISNLATFAQENPNPILMFASDGRLTYYNDAAMQVAKSFGWDHPASWVPAQAPAIVESCLLSGEQRLRVAVVQNQRTFSWSFYPHRSGGVVHAFVKEVTQQVNLEEQLRYSQRLEGIGRLAGGVAHEFSNLLTVIQGQAQIISESGLLDPRSREAMQQLLHATERGSSIAHQLQTFSRRNRVSPCPLQMNDVVQNLSGLLNRTLGDHIRLSVEADPELPEIQGDRGLLEQAILNLAVFARDSMLDGGELTITTDLVDFPPNQPRSHPEARAGRFVRIRVRDTGRGIDPKLLPHVFEPFFNGNPSTADGLGLSTAYGIVKQHRGWIDLASRIGTGSCFTLFLPAVTPPSAATPPMESTPVARSLKSSHTVLLVEDDPAVRWTLKSLLELEGFQTLEASNPLEALALWRTQQQRITVLLTDVVMPSGISGQELARHLLESKPRLKVIYTSGYCIDSVARGLPVEAGVNFLQKPFSGPDFTRALLKLEEEEAAHAQPSDTPTLR